MRDLTLLKWVLVLRTRSAFLVRVEQNLKKATFKFAMQEKPCHVGMKVFIWGSELSGRTDGVKALRVCG